MFCELCGEFSEKTEEVELVNIPSGNTPIATLSLCPSCLTQNDMVCKKHGPVTLFRLLPSFCEEEDDDYLLSCCPDCIQDRILQFGPEQIALKAFDIRQMFPPQLVEAFERDDCPLDTEDPDVRLLFSIHTLSDIYNLTPDDTIEALASGGELAGT